MDKLELMEGKSAGTAIPAPSRVCRVWLVDDDATLRQLFCETLSKQPGIRCTRQFDAADELLACLAEERPPDVILLDVHLGPQSGLDYIRPIKAAAPTVKVLMWTIFSNSHKELTAFRAGASGFLLKSYELGEMVKLIHAANRNQDAPELFPYVALRRQAGLPVELEDPDQAEPVKRFTVARAWEQLRRSARRQTVF